MHSRRTGIRRGLAALALSLAAGVYAQIPLPPSVPPPSPIAPGAPPMPADPDLTPAAPPQISTDTNGQKLVALKFNQAPASQLLQFYGELTGRTLLEAPAITATITLRSQSKLTVDECLQAIRTVLAMNNVGLVDVGTKFTKVVPVANMQVEGLRIESNAWDRVVHPENDQIISEIVTLRYIELADAQKVAAGLIHTYGKIVALDRINSLLIADSAININRIREVLAQIDQPIEAREKLQILPIRHAKASEVKAKIEEILADDKTKGAAATVPRARTSGPPGMETVVPSPSRIPGVIRAPTVLPVRVNTTSDTIGDETTEEGRLIRGNVKIVADDRTSVLIILTRPENMPFFEKIVNALDIPTQPDFVVQVVRLEYADVEIVVTILNNLIGAQTPKELLANTSTRLAPLTSSSGGGSGGSATQPGVGGYGTGGAMNSGTANSGGGRFGEAAAPTRSASLESFAQQNAAQLNAAGGDASKTKIGMLSAQNIRILPDKRSNGLVIMAPRADIATIMDLIKEMDIQISQVMVETVIVEVTLSKDITTGVDWLQRSMIAYNKTASGSRKPIFGFAGAAGAGDNQTRDATSLNAAGALGPVGGLSYYMTYFGLNLDAVVHMVASDNRSRVLSSPVIMTMDNEEATIDVATEQYIYKGSSPVNAGNTITYVPNVESQRVGTKLKVKPHINKNKYVSMDIQQTIDDVAGTQPITDASGLTTKWPIIGSRQFDAKISVQSGETVVLGGLVKSTAINDQSGIPFLSKIPLLGYLFRSDSSSKARSEVIVFLTPHVLNTTDEIMADSKRRRDVMSLDNMWRYGWSGSKLAEGYTNAAPTNVISLPTDAGLPMPITTNKPVASAAGGGKK